MNEDLVKFCILYLIPFLTNKGVCINTCPWDKFLTLNIQGSDELILNADYVCRWHTDADNLLLLCDPILGPSEALKMFFRLTSFSYDMAFTLNMSLESHRVW